MLDHAAHNLGSCGPGQAAKLGQRVIGRPRVFAPLGLYSYEDGFFSGLFG